MIDVVHHVELIESKLENIDARGKGKFGAWCGFFLWNQENIKHFLTKHLDSDIVEIIKNSIETGWRGSFNRKYGEMIDAIDSIDWNRDLSDGEDGEQGAEELLGCVSSMLTALEKNSAEYAANCGERVINFIDYENPPPTRLKSDYEKLITSEFNLQIDFINHLKNDDSHLKIDSLR